MDLKVSLLIGRASNEILAARALKKISDEPGLKQQIEFPAETTFYSNVISNSYYSIFYSAKAYLLSKKITVLSEQGQHQFVYFKFRKLVEEGIVEKELLRIYDEVKGRAEALLEILKSEREKRKDFTYETLPQANKQPAEDSLNNAVHFLSHIKELLRIEGGR